MIFSKFETFLIFHLTISSEFFENMQNSVKKHQFSEINARF